MAETLPLFPLGTVLMPGATLPLHIFEPRYRQLTVDLVTGTLPARCFGVVAIRSGTSGEIDSVEQLYGIGCTAALLEAKQLSDGRFDIITKGDRRFRLVDLDATSAPYLVATIEWLPDATMAQESTDALPRLVEAARAAHRRYCDAAWQREDWTEPSDDIDPSILAHLMASDCLLSVQDRQRLLEETSSARRLALVRRLLNREAGFLGTLRAVPVPLSELGSQASMN